MAQERRMRLEDGCIFATPALQNLLYFAKRMGEPFFEQRGKYLTEPFRTLLVIPGHALLLTILLAELKEE
jgi:hypothetical protein